MPGPRFLDGRRLSLHTIDREDLRFLRRHANDPGMREGLTLATPETEGSIERFYENTVCGDDDVVLLAVRDGDPVGMVALFDVEPVPGRARLGAWMAPRAQGDGLGTEAVGLLVDYAFTERRLHKLTADCLATNDASRHLLERLGFLREGVLRDHEFVDGEHVDSLLYALLVDDWDGLPAAVAGGELLQELDQ
jgi:RimJ/RimL family protein N-acetyltransferase